MARTVPVVKSGPTGPPGPAGTGITDWITLTDTDPTTYTSFKDHAVVVNTAEDGLTFSDNPIQNLPEQPTYSTTNVNAGSVVIGQPVYGVSPSGVDLAKADALLTSLVVGLLVTDAATLATTTFVSSGYITRVNWTAITGATGLVQGSRYFLDVSTEGMLTVTAPTGSGEYVVQVGVAVDASTLSILIQPPILLV
jgi:hypothetical protein